MSKDKEKINNLINYIKEMPKEFLPALEESEKRIIESRINNEVVRIGLDKITEKVAKRKAYYLKKKQEIKND